MKLQFVVSAHKVIGMTATIFIVILSVTGILLMHTDDLALDDTYVDNQGVLALYDIAPNDRPVSFRVNNNYITQLDDRVYLNVSEIVVIAERLIGVVFLDDIYIAGLESALILFTVDGEIIEILDQAHGIPLGITAIGVINNRIVVNANGDLKSTDLNMTTWKDHLQANVNWSEHTDPPDQLMDTILKQYLGNGLPMERVILDIHSGRILGTAGVVLVDLAVVLFLIMSISGWLAWYKRRELQKLIDDEEAQLNDQ